METFGLQEHDDKHRETERVLRRLVGQVGHVNINLNRTCVELRKLPLEVDGKIEGADVIPPFSVSTRPSPTATQERHRPPNRIAISRAGAAAEGAL
ncbi:MAG: hypothetical protein QNJ81_05255 [Acidimicrobiia bacterium]|nr:hypothetical protein [Acidimicrobiia bacterium]